MMCVRLGPYGPEASHLLSPKRPRQWTWQIDEGWGREIVNGRVGAVNGRVACPWGTSRPADWYWGAPVEPLERDKRDVGDAHGRGFDGG